MGLGDVTKPAIEAAIAEFDSIGNDAFLTRYRFKRSIGYWLLYNGRRYPSKAIVGAAHGFIRQGSAPLAWDDFKGSERTVAAKLRRLGFDVETPARNPVWTRDELVLALDLYFTNPASPPGKDSAAVFELSNLLNKLQRLNGAEATDTLRNPNGIYLKMMNFRAADPAYVAQGKVGMTRGNALEGGLWKEFDGRRKALAIEARAIRDAIQNADQAALSKLPPVEPYEGEEGGIIVSLHRRYERDPKLVAEKKKEASAAGQLACEVCGFDFAKRFGELGLGFIEVHHTKPIHQIKGRSRTKLSDLALLCPNCHRMAHRKRHPLSLDELRAAWRPVG